LNALVVLVEQEVEMFWLACKSKQGESGAFKIIIIITLLLLLLLVRIIQSKSQVGLIAVWPINQSVRRNYFNSRATSR